MRRLLLVLLAVGLAGADEAREKEIARIKYRQELKKKFTRHNLNKLSNWPGWGVR